MQRKIFYSTLLLSALFSTQVLAHNVKTNVDVGVTFHIEPDHSPRVGEASQAWFALTRKGGELISLSQCDCDLKVYLESGDRSSDAANDPILNPSLIAISPEKYQNIPGANLTFPQPGIYQLQLTGKPTAEGDFTPFQVSYPVTVKPNLTAPKEIENKVSDTEPTIEPSSEEIATNVDIDKVSKSSPIYPWLICALIGGLGLVTIFTLKK